MFPKIQVKTTKQRGYFDLKLENASFSSQRKKLKMFQNDDHVFSYSIKYTKNKIDFFSKTTYP